MTPIAWVKNYVPGFARLTQPERTAIYHFTLLWCAFEGRLLSERGSPNALRNLVSELHADGLINASQLAEPLAYFRDRYWSHDGPGERLNALRLNKSERTEVEQALSGENQATDAILRALLFIVHRLRNNLFHGPKLNHGMVDQRQNFRTASALMMATMEMHMGMWPNNGVEQGNV